MSVLQTRNSVVYKSMSLLFSVDPFFSLWLFQFKFKIFDWNSDLCYIFNYLNLAGCHFCLYSFNDYVQCYGYKFLEKEILDTFFQTFVSVVAGPGGVEPNPDPSLRKKTDPDSTVKEKGIRPLRNNWIQTWFSKKTTRFWIRKFSLNLFS